MVLPHGYRETIVTPKSLRNVEAVWSYVATRPGRDLVLPDGRCDIILRGKSNRREAPIPILTGPATQAHWVEFEPGDTWLGLRLCPQHAAALWGRQISKAHDRVLRGREALAVLPELAQVAHPDATEADLTRIVDILPDISSAKDVGRVVDVLHASGGQVKMDRLASLAGWSTRHLSRVFRQRVGLPTKAYAQLVQFHRALRLVRVEGLSLAATAIEAGYADQAHMARAFRRFGGFSPSAMPPELAMPTLFPT